MKIILIKSIPKFGQAGEVKEVTEGYARNFLIPKGLADLATKHSLGQITAQKSKIEKLNLQTKKNRQKMLKSIDRKKITVQVKADEKGTLYAGISKKSLSDELKEQGYEIEPKDIKLKEKIKKIGKKKIELKMNGKKAIINLEIISK